MQELNLSVVPAVGQAVILVTGDLDAMSYGQLDALLEEHAPSDGKVVLDLSGLTFLDSRGLGSIVALWQRLQRHGGSLVIAGARYESARVLWITGLADRLTLADAVEPKPA
ncbi:MAG: STAS domain-containing protein [Streptosporangiaceae bacterium]